jgi:hypothetical protein
MIGLAARSDDIGAMGSKTPVNLVQLRVLSRDHHFTATKSPRGPIRQNGPSALVDLAGPARNIRHVHVLIVEPQSEPLLELGTFSPNPI